MREVRLTFGWVLFDNAFARHTIGVPITPASRSGLHAERDFYCQFKEQPISISITTILYPNNPFVKSLND